jgi:adenosylmethionine-8-amino-7-oxononanoate aminotransferase
MHKQIWRPYTQEKIASAPIALKQAKGCYLYTSSGQRLLDGISSWWLITHGHCHPAIVEAIQLQTAKMDQVIFANFTHEPAEELAERLIDLTPPALSRVFFSDNGSTAVEVALKMALQACSQLGRPKKQKFVTFERAYHGDTVGAMSVSGDSSFNRPYGKTLFPTVKAKQAHLSTASEDEYVGDFERIIKEQHEDLAGVILEPLIQAAGGMIFWPKAAVQKIGKLCRDYGVLLIFDEVMTGFGRTGELFALDHLGVTPDFLCLSKGLTGGSLPLSVTMTTESVYEAFLDQKKEKMFFHGHSFTGNPISCAAAVANLRAWRDEQVLQKLPNIRSANRRALAKLKSRLGINDPRVCGTVAAFDLPTEAAGYLNPAFDRMTSLAIEKGLFMRPLGNTIYLMPPYCTPPEEIEQAWMAIGDILSSLS